MRRALCWLTCLKQCEESERRQRLQPGTVGGPLRLRSVVKCEDPEVQTSSYDHVCTLKLVYSRQTLTISRMPYFSVPVMEPPPAAFPFTTGAAMPANLLITRPERRRLDVSGPNETLCKDPPVGRALLVFGTRTSALPVRSFCVDLEVDEEPLS